MLTPTSRASGFTLIELLVVMVVFALLMAAAMPSYRVWTQNTMTRSAAESFVGGLMVARNEALRRNSTVAFAIDSYTAWHVACTAVTPGCPDTSHIQERAAGEGSSSSVTVTASNGGEVRFDSFGRMSFPVLAAGTTMITFDFDNSKLSASDSRKLRVTVDTGGNVRMCDPKVTDSSDPRKC